MPLANAVRLHVAPVQEETRGAVLFDEARAELFGHLAFALAAPQIQLPQAVARGRKALGKEQVRLVLGVDVRHAVLVPDDFHGLREPGHGNRVLLAAWRGATRQHCDQAACQECGGPALERTHRLLLRLLIFSLPAVRQTLEAAPNATPCSD